MDRQGSERSRYEVAGQSQGLGLGVAILSAVGSFLKSAWKWIALALAVALSVLAPMYWLERTKRKRETERADAAVKAAKTATAAMRVEAQAGAEQRRIAEGLAAEREQNRIAAEHLREEAERLRKERDAERERIRELEPDALTEELNETLGHSQ